MADRTTTSPQLGLLLVRDCMHHGIFSCTPDAPLGEVAGVMSMHRVHAVAVAEDEGQCPLGIVSDLDVVAAAVSGDQPTALQAAATEPLTISAHESIQRAAQLMTEHGVSHLVVMDAASGHPVGILSTLDIASAYAR